MSSFSPVRIRKDLEGKSRCVELVFCRTPVYILCFSAQRRPSFFPRLLCWSRSATCSRCWTAATSEVRFSKGEIEGMQNLASFTVFTRCCVSDAHRCSRTCHQAAAPITDSRQTTGGCLSPFSLIFNPFMLS